MANTRSRSRQQTNRRHALTRVTALVFVLVFLFGSVTAALACWTTILQECFERSEPQWPWFNPAGSGRRWINCVVVNGSPICYPSIPNAYLRWGVQDDFFNNSICPPDHDAQSCWVIGQPRTQDPEFDTYPPNLDTYMYFGPLNLQGRTAAHVTFYLLNQSEVDHDSIFWGASTVVPLTAAGMQIGGSYSGTPTPLEYQIVQFDLSNLRNYQTHDSVSMLDSAAVYVFWRFQADNNPNSLYVGPFIDEIVIRLDDGCLDLFANDIILHRPDGRILNRDPEIGDSIYAEFSFSTCDGAVDATYPPFHAIATLGDMQLINEFVQGADRHQTFIYNSPIWVINEPGDFNIRFNVDSLGEVTECVENNNVDNFQYHVSPPNVPPQFTWIEPGADTLFIATSDYLKWECYDPNDQASISIYYDFDDIGCEGILVPGGSLIAENDGPDSLLWDLSLIPDGTTYFVFAQVSDPEGTICVYGPRPVVKRALGAGEPVVNIPREMYLTQNFPNPFNPQTEIRYGIARGGAVTLRAYDLLGREIATLVNRELSPGNYHATFDGSAFGSGLYFYTLTAPEGSRSGKMMLLK